MNFRDWLITINSKGQLMISATDGNAECVLLKLFDRNGNLLQSLQLKLPVTESDADYRRRVIGIASDRANNVFLLTGMLTLGRSLRGTVIVFDQHANFQHEFDVDGYLIGSCIAVSDDSKVFVSAKVGERGCVRVYNFNGVPLNSIENRLLESVKEMRSIDSESGRIVVLGCGLDYFGCTHICQFSDQGTCLFGYYVPSNDTDRVRLLHKTEHVVELNFSKENLFLYNKDGMVVREIKLSTFIDLYYLHEPEFTVTTQGLVAMLTTDKRTGERMIAIL